MNKYKNLSNYTTHQQNYPLQLTGTMKRHINPVKQNIKDFLNHPSAHEMFNARLLESSKPQHSPPLNPPSQSIKILTDKIIDNNKIKRQNYEKNVIPYQDPRGAKLRPESVRTYKQTRQGSGVNFLLANTKCIYKHTQKKHISQFHIPQRQTFGKRCNSAVQKNNQIRQSLLQESQVLKIDNLTSNPNFRQISQSFDLVPKTLQKRVSEDIHSSIYKLQQSKPNGIRRSTYSQKNQLKSGVDLGYEDKKQKSISYQKMGEIMGSFYHEKQPNNIRRKRDDWRRSNVVIA